MRHSSLGTLENSRSEFSRGESCEAREGRAAPLRMKLVSELRQQRSAKRGPQFYEELRTQDTSMATEYLNNVVLIRCHYC
jgi:hypothetical protein